LIIDTSIKLHEFSKNNQNICFKVCWPETPTCPDGWVSFISTGSERTLN
jgi:hypothetical protein